MSQEADAQQHGCSCTNLYLHLAMLAGILAGAASGLRSGIRLHTWWGGPLGAVAGGALGGFTFLIAAILLLMVVGLIACGVMQVDEWWKRWSARR